MKNLTIITLFYAAFFSSNTCAHAQDELDLLENFLQQDPAGIEAIALYPEEIRHAILEAAAHPEIIVKLAGVQTKSSDAFDTLIDAYEPEQQEQIWNLVRFPKLIDQLTDTDIKSKKQIRTILKPYPKAIHATAHSLGRKEYDLLVEISRLNRTTDQAFKQLIAPYPEITQVSLETLVGLPEILTLLKDDLELTILLGDAYRQNPLQIKDHARQLNLEATRKNALDTQTPEKSHGTDDSAAPTKSAKRLTFVEAAAQAYYARYSPDTKLESSVQTEADADPNVTYYHHPYPYWYGYPRYHNNPYTYGHPGYHGALNWYITPHVSASIHLSPRLYHGRYYNYGYRHHYNRSTSRGYHHRSYRPKASRRYSHRRYH
jgi:hypothetical protein